MAHITDEQIKKYYLHCLKQNEEIDMLTHIAECEFCAGRFATGFPETEMIKFPHGVSAEILEKAEKIPTKQSRQKEYYGYCVRVALGMCMALGILVTVNFSNGGYSQNLTKVGNVIEKIDENANVGVIKGGIQKNTATKRTDYEKKQSAMKKKQEENRKKFFEQRSESSGNRFFNINKIGEWIKNKFK